jgi:hypothetical protein
MDLMRLTIEFPKPSTKSRPTWHGATRRTELLLCPGYHTVSVFHRGIFLADQRVVLKSRLYCYPVMELYQEHKPLREIERACFQFPPCFDDHRDFGLRDAIYVF